jgi:hypothetical protein
VFSSVAAGSPNSDTGLTEDVSRYGCMFLLETHSVASVARATTRFAEVILHALLCSSRLHGHSRACGQAGWRAES